MNKKVYFQGASLTLVGRNVQENQYGPQFKVVSADIKEVTLLDLEDKIKVLTSFPSLDTPVCDMQVKEFNKRATALSKDIVIVGISKDLPFAQKRFCAEHTIDQILIFSDFKYSSFGINYGILIKELNLLARAAFILDKNNVIRHIQLTDDITKALDYDLIIEKLQGVITSPTQNVAQAIPNHCVPCEGGVRALTADAITKKLSLLSGWQVVDGKKITKEITTQDYQEAKLLLDMFALIAEEQGHHPTLTLLWNKVKVSLTTHAASGLTDNDFIMARIIDEITVGKP